jgi:hypothetical protein
MRILTATLVVLVSTLAFGGESPIGGYWVCQSAANLDPIYFSSTYDALASNDSNAFAQYLNTKYGYTGRANCSVADKTQSTVQRMQQSYNATVAQWRSLGKKVVETGWTNHGAPALTTNAPLAPATPVVAKPQVRAESPDDQPMAKKNVPMSHFYCATQRSGSNPLYLSGSFEVASSELPAVSKAFQAYLAQKYGDAGPIAVSCYNFPSVAVADQRKQGSIANLKKTPVKVIDTGWVYKTQ